MQQTLYHRMNHYLDQRTGTYEFRTQRYKSVADKLLEMGLKNGDLVVDLGAGRCEFDRYLHSRGVYARYMPIDASIDGTDLNDWTAKRLHPDFYVAIEILEHLENPQRLMLVMENSVRWAMVVTTPNSSVVDTLAMDSTHVTPMFEEDFILESWKTQIKSHFGKANDSILAWRRK